MADILAISDWHSAIRPGYEDGKQFTMRILVVEDEKKLAGFIRRALVEDSHAVDVGADGEEGSYLAGSDHYDLAILDILLPKKDGLAILRELREVKGTTQGLMLSARGQVKDPVHG